MADTKKPGRRDYLNSYVKTSSGEYVYTGKHHVLNSPCGIRSATAVYVLFPLLSLALFFLMGVLPITSGNTYYVILPFVLSAVPITLSLTDALTVALSKGRLKSHRYDKHLPRLKFCTVISAVLSCATAISEVVFIIKNQVIPAISPDMAFLCLCIAICVINVIYFVIQRKYKWFPEQ